MKFKQVRNLYEGVKRQIKEVRDAFYSRRDAVIRFIETPINEEAVARFNAIVKNTDNNIDKYIYEQIVRSDASVLTIDDYSITNLKNIFSYILIINYKDTVVNETNSFYISYIL